MIAVSYLPLFTLFSFVLASFCQAFPTLSLKMDMYSPLLSSRCFSFRFCELSSHVFAMVLRPCSIGLLISKVNQTCIGAQSLREMNWLLKISVLEKFCSHPLTRTTERKTLLCLSQLRVKPSIFNTWLTMSLTVIAIKDNLIIDQSTNLSQLNR